MKPIISDMSDEHEAFKLKRQQDRLAKLLKLSDDWRRAVEDDPVAFLSKAGDRLHRLDKAVKDAIYELHGGSTMQSGSDLEPVNITAEQQKRINAALETLKRALSEGDGSE